MVAEGTKIFRDTSSDLVRKLIDERVATLGFEEERRRECVLAVSEIATNSVRYGGGHGSLR